LVDVGFNRCLFHYYGLLYLLEGPFSGEMEAHPPVGIPIF
jgi:hypothetical protein